DKDLIVNAGAGAAIFLGPVGGQHVPRNLNVTGNSIFAGSSVLAAIRADFTVGAGGMAQGGGPISAPGIGLFGTGSFALGTTVNNVGSLGLRVNLTGPGAAVAFTDVDQLLVDNSSTAAGIKTANGSVTLKSGGDFRAEVPLGAPLDTLMIDLGTGPLAVFPGLAGKAKVVFNVEVKAGSVTLGTAG